MFDEVQTGVGRTGKLFAYEHFGVAPDIMAIAKGIGGGYPLGAFLATKEAARGMTAGTHGTTFGGNPLAASIGNAVLDVVLAPGFIERVASLGLRLKQGLARFKGKTWRDHPGDSRRRSDAGHRLAMPVTDFAAAARAEGFLSFRRPKMSRGYCRRSSSARRRFPKPSRVSTPPAYGSKAASLKAGRKARAGRPYDRSPEGQGASSARAAFS